MKRIFSILQIMPSSEPMDWPMPAQFNWTLLTGAINKRAYIIYYVLYKAKNDNSGMSKTIQINLDTISPFFGHHKQIHFFLHLPLRPHLTMLKKLASGQKSLNDRLVKGSLTKNVGHWQLLEEKGLLISALNWHQVWRTADFQNVSGKVGKSEECE